MKASRNDPCPCGSGRKYKACCMAADQAKRRAAELVGEDTLRAAEEAWQDIARRAPVWQADVAPVAAGMRDSPDGTALAMVTAAGYVATVNVLGHRPGTVDERARALSDALSAAARVLGVYPEVLQVREAEVAAVLSRELAPRDVRAEAARLDELDEALDATLDNLSGERGAGRFTLALTWRETGASAQALADFHDAAAEFFDHTPWIELGDGNPLAVRLPDGQEWTASVMGGAGLAYGLGLYSAVEDLLAIMAAERSGTEMLREMAGHALTVSYDSRDELTRTMRREIAAGGWRIASPEAYPRMYGMNLPQRRITPAQVHAATMALRSIACLARGENPLDACGVQIEMLPDHAEELYAAAEDRPWELPERPRPITAEGPGADPAAALRCNELPDPFRDKEQARLARFARWLEARGVAKTAAKADQRIARAWAEYLDMMGIPASAATEYDFRQFVYLSLPRFIEVPQSALRVLPRALHRLAGFLEEAEGIRYPFAAEVIAEVEAFWRRADEAGETIEDVLDEVSEEVMDDLYLRNLLPESLFRDYGDEPTDAQAFGIVPLNQDLQRRWLLWHDEEVRSGVADWPELEERLSARQTVWEQTPNPHAEGRTPAEAVRQIFGSDG